MSFYTTKKGTELPILDLRGKPYLQVAHRIVWMREENPFWAIETEILRMEKDESVVRATIKNEAGVIIAQATKREDKAGFGDHLEKAETGAIGRALALCGYGTQFCSDDFDEGERLADSPVPAARIKSNGVYTVTFGKHKGKTLEELGPEECRNYGSWLAKQERKPQSDELLDKMREYLAAK